MIEQQIEDHLQSEEDPKVVAEFIKENEKCIFCELATKYNNNFNSAFWKEYERCISGAGKVTCYSSTGELLGYSIDEALYNMSKNNK